MVRSSIAEKKTHETRSITSKKKFIEIKNNKLIIRFQHLKSSLSKPDVPNELDIIIEPVNIDLDIDLNIDLDIDLDIDFENLKNLSSREIIKIYHPSIIYDLLTEDEINEIIKPIFNYTKENDIFSPGLRPSEFELKEIPKINL